MEALNEEHMEPLNDYNMEVEEFVEPLQADDSEIHSNTGAAIPEECNELKSFVDKQFQTLDEAEHFYRSYAQSIGFDYRLHHYKKNKDGEIIRREFVCNKQGKHQQELEGTEKRRRGVGRASCNARMIIVKSKVEGFRVTIFDEAHNHDLVSPRRRHLMKSRRRLTTTQRSLTEQLGMVNIPPSQQFDILGVQTGGLENIGCTLKDMYNYERDKRISLKGHDGNMLHDHFMLEQERNSGFIYKIQADDDNKITQCFWSDAVSRKSYAIFGDVIIFDTTYNTNRYGMIFAPIMGVNNHGQTIILSGAFLSNEKTESFILLFQEFLKIMPGGAPKMIITDQDPAMAKAIEVTLPDTLHRYCSWHILNKFSDKLDAVKMSEYYQEMKRCVYGSETKCEFNSGWNSILEKSDLVNNKWLKSLYDIRDKWVPAYVNHVFGADMTSSQRAESGHSFFKGYVSKSNSLSDFMIQFNRGLLKQRQKEVIADHTDINEKPRFKLPLKMEKQMADIYTRTYFYKFQEELWESYNYITQFVSESDTHCIYNSKIDDENGRVREIIYDKNMELASCSCQLFESAGMPCRHILSFLLKVHQAHILPDQYILKVANYFKMWTKFAKSDVVVDHDGVEINISKSLLGKRSELFQRYSHAIDKALLNDETSQIFVEAMDSVIQRMDAISIVDSGVASVGVASRTSNASIGSYNEPDAVKFKGSGSRLKKAKEAFKPTKSRRCNGCGKIGVSHDKRNCPRLLNMTSTLCDHDDSVGGEISRDDNSSDDS